MWRYLRIFGLYKNKEFNTLAEAINNLVQRVSADKSIIQGHLDEIYYTANFDSLTGLQNWYSLEKHLSEMIKIAESERYMIGVFFSGIYMLHLCKEVLYLFYPWF